LASGVSADEVCTEYELNRELILAALRYATWLSSQETVRVRAG